MVFASILESRRSGGVDDVCSPVAGEIEDLIDRACALGVEIQVDIDEGQNILWLASIERVAGVRGSGSAILEELQEIADDYDMSIAGKIEPACKGLIDYYRKNGFEIMDSRQGMLLSYP